MSIVKDHNIVIASSIGSLFEVFDFLNFIFLSTIISNLFFPAKNHSLAMLLTYLTITISYVLRPIGGIILGHFGDRYGRKSIFIISILLMALPSFFISILPTYAQIGYFAPFLLIVLRMLQGFSLGGEMPGAVTYIIEKFHQQNFYFYSAFLTLGANLGVVLAALFTDLLTSLTSSHFMYTFGWRIPFFCGGVLAIIGFYIRNNLSESQEFLAADKTSVPIATLLKNYKIKLSLGIILSLQVSVITSIFHIILPSICSNYFKYSLATTTKVSIFGALTMAILSPIIGLLTNYFAPTRIVQLGLLLLILIFAAMSLGVIDFNHIIICHYLINLYAVIGVISVAAAMINGIFFGIMANLFSATIRFTGIATSFNIAYILGAGLTPIWCNLSISLTHNFNPIIFLCLAITIITLVYFKLFTKIYYKV